MLFGVRSPITKCSLPPRVVESVRFWNQTDIALLTGLSGIFPLSLLWAVHLVTGNRQVHLIDCAMRGNAFTVADEAMRLGQQPEAILQAITIQRAFTPYQILDVMSHILDHPGEKIHFILAPCKQFFDGDVSEDEGLYLLQKLVDVIQEFPKYNVPLLIVELPMYNHSAFPFVYARMNQIASPIYELKITEKEFRPEYAIQISGVDKLQRQKSIWRGTKHGKNATTLFDANRVGKRAI